MNTASSAGLEQRIPYFAYGSNLDSQQMAERCSGALKGLRAILPGYQFIINSRGVASVVPHEECEVEGLLWDLTKEDERSLDSYEGVSKGYYKKHLLNVSQQDGKEVRALVYIATSNKAGKPRQGYLEKIIASAKKVGLSPAYMECLKSWI